MSRIWRVTLVLAAAAALSFVPPSAADTIDPFTTQLPALTAPPPPATFHQMLMKDGPVWVESTSPSSNLDIALLSPSNGPPGDEPPSALADLNGQWSEASLEPGPLRQSQSQIYDPTRHRIVLFGGADAVDHNDTWVLDLSQPTAWRIIATQGALPAVRRLHGAVFDPVRDRMLVFGGYSAGYFNDLWELTFTGPTPTWTQLFPTGPAPAARAGHSVLYDPIADRLIVFGGHDGVSAPFLRRNDVWELPLSGPLAWHQLTPSGTLPSPRSGHSTIYDPVRQRMLICAGTASGSSFLNDVWALALSGPLAWSQLSPGGALPRTREEHCAIYEPTGDRMVIFGGYDETFDLLNDTWALSLASNNWTHLFPIDAAPLERWGHQAIYDPVANRMVVHGGYTYYSYSRATPMLYFNLSGNLTWVAGAPARQGQSMVYDPIRHRTILFGGALSVDRNDCWEFSGTPGALWTPINTTGTPPPARRLHGAIFDAIRDRMLVFGGYSGSFFNDLWELKFVGSNATWTQLAPAGTAPVPRAGGSVAYDPVADRLLVFGGYDGVSPPNLRRNDLWELPLSGPLAWHQLTPGGPLPIPRSGHSTIYDPARQQMVIFGGTASGSAFFNEVWGLALSGPLVWNQLTPAGIPPASREEHSAIYEPGSDRMVIFGGYDQAFDLLRDAWSLSLSSPTWTQLSPIGMGPDERWGHKAIYDPVGGRMLVHGGFTYHSYSPESWFLTWGLTTPVEVHSFTAIHVANGIGLSWTTALESNILGFDLYRSEGESRGRITAEPVPATGPGRYDFVDRNVAAGHSYGYELEVIDIGGQREIVGQIEVQATGTQPMVLVLRQNHPNPFNPSTMIRFELPVSGHTSLRIFDSNGRLVRSLIEGELAATEHEVTWDGTSQSGANVGSGVYVYRLETPGKVLSRKMVLTR